MVRSWRIVFPVLKYLILTVILYTVGRIFYTHLTTIDYDTLHLNPWLFLMALLVEMASRLGTGLAYHFQLKSYSHEIGWAPSTAISWVAALGKYVPGKVGILIGASYYLTQCSVPPVIAVSLPVLSTGMMVTIAFAMSLSLDYLILPTPVVPPYLPPLAVVLVVWGGPFLLLKGGGLIARYFDRISNWLPRDISPLRSANGVLFLQLVLSGFSAWLVSIALAPEPLVSLPMMIGLTALSIGSGVVAFFCPAGIGVKEGVLLLGLGAGNGSELAALVIILIRITQTLADLITGGMGYGYLKQKRAP